VSPISTVFLGGGGGVGTGPRDQNRQYISLVGLTWHLAPCNPVEMRRRRPPAASRIEWDRQPLGIETDGAIAKRLGVTASAVLGARRRRGIPPAVPQGNPRVDWNNELLGIETDYALARRLGVTETAVSKARKRRGIGPAVLPSSAREIPLLGKMPDVALARELGISQGRVGELRRKRGIPKFRRNGA
jgi:hypothetical protein